MPVATATGFAPAMIDLGARAWGQVIPVELTFVNRGSEPLTVREVKSSCGCTVVSEGLPAGHIIEPGGSRRIAARLDTQLNPGPRQRTISLVTQRGETYDVRITLEVEATWSVTPEVVDLGDVSLDEQVEPASRIVLFSSARDRLIEPPTVDSPWLTCAALGADPPGQTRFALSVHRSALKPGLNVGTVRFTTDNRTKPATIVQARVRAFHEISARPETLTVSRIRGATVSVFDHAGNFRRLARVVEAPDWLLVRLTPHGTAEVRACWEPAAPTGHAPTGIVRVADERANQAEFRVIVTE